MALDVFPELLSPLKESLPMVEDVEPNEGAPVTELPVTELLLLAKLSRLPLLLRPVLL